MVALRFYLSARRIRCFIVCSDMEIVIRNAEARDIEAVSSILVEVATWLEDRGIPLWRADELAPEHIEGEVLNGLFVLAEVGGRGSRCNAFSA